MGVWGTRLEIGATRFDGGAQDGCQFVRLRKNALEPGWTDEFRIRDDFQPVDCFLAFGIGDRNPGGEIFLGSSITCFTIVRAYGCPGSDDLRPDCTS